MKVEHWMQTLGSGALDLVRPDPASINLDTVATVLARIPRYAGHTERGPFSVAQHSVEGAHAILRDGFAREAAAAFLLHDAHEAFIGDDATPKVEALAVIATEEEGDLYAGDVVRRAHRALKARLDEAIYAAAGIERSRETRAIVRLYDLRMLRTERDARLAPPPKPWADVVEAAAAIAGCDLNPWRTDVAETAFRAAMRELGIPGARRNV